MRRIQYNLAYLAAIADRSHKPSSQIPPHPAVISAPALSPLPKPPTSSPSSPNGAVKLGTDGAADIEGEDRAETLKKQYRRLQELFPGVDPKKEPVVQPAQAAQKQQQQQQQQPGPSAPQKAQMAAQMQAQLAQMSQAQKMEFMQRKGMVEAGGQFANRPPGQQMPQQPNAQQQQQQQLNRMRQQQQQQQQMQQQQQQAGWRPGQPGGPQQGQQRMGPGMQQGGGMDMGGMGMGGSPAVQGMQQPLPGQGQ